MGWSGWFQLFGMLEAQLPELKKKERTNESEKKVVLKSDPDWENWKSTLNWPESF